MTNLRKHSVMEAQNFSNEVGFGQAGSLVAENSAKFANTVAAAHDNADGSETASEGSGGVVIDVSNSFPAGVTIYGRWSEIDIDSGMLIAYIGI